MSEGGVRRLLRWLLDLEHEPYGWDVRVPWPAMRLFHSRKFTTGGVLHRVGVYRIAAFEYVLEWWRSH